MKPDKGQHVFHYNRYLHLLLYEFQEILFEAASIKRVEHHTRFQFLFDVKFPQKKWIFMWSIIIHGF